MGILDIISGILMLVSSLLIIILTLAQAQKQQDMSSALSGQSDNFYGKGGKTSSREESLASLTKICAVIFFVVTLAVNIISAMA